MGHACIVRMCAAWFFTIQREQLTDPIGFELQLSLSSKSVYCFVLLASTKNTREFMYILVGSYLHRPLYFLPGVFLLHTCQSVFHSGTCCLISEVPQPKFIMQGVIQRENVVYFPRKTIEFFLDPSKS